MRVIQSTNVDERVFFMETGGVQFRRKEKKTRRYGYEDSCSGGCRIKILMGLF